MLSRTNFLIICGLVLIISFSSALGQNYEIESPTPSFPRFVTANRDGSSVYYCSNSASSLWKYSNGESTCLDPILRSQGTEYFSIRSMVPLSQNCDSLLLCMGNNSTHQSPLYVTYDGGANWACIPCPYGNVKIIINPNDPNFWISGLLDGTIVSTDAGNNWTYEPWLSGDSNVRLYFMFFDTPEDSIYYGLFRDFTEDNYYVCRYRREQNHWDFRTRLFDFIENFNISNGQIKSMIQLSNGEYLMSIYCPDPYNENYLENNVIVLDENFQQIARSGSEFIDQFTLGTLLEDPLNPGTIYTISHYLYKSQDFGRTWNPCGMDGLPDLLKYETYNLSQPENSSDLYLSVCNSGLYKSQDGGESWLNMNIADVGRSSHLLSFSNTIIDSYNGPMVYYKNDFGPWNSLNFGSDPENCNTYNQLVYCNNDTMIVKSKFRDLSQHPEVGDDLILRISVDGGISWTDHTNPYHNIVAIYQNDIMRLLKPMMSSNLFFAFSDDMGETWIERTRGCQFTMSENFFYSNIYLENDTQYVMRMGINDDQWIPLHQPLDMNIRFIENWGDDLFVADPSGNCFFDFGYGWVQKGQMDDFQTVNPDMFEVDDALYIAHISEYPYVFHLSLDTTMTWMDRDIIFPGETNCGYIRDFHYDPYRNRIWINSNVATVWAPFEEFLTNSSEPVQFLPSDYKLFTNYPNPFNASTRIQYHLEKPGNVKLEVYDITGRWVKTLEDSYKPAGAQNVFFDGSGLASGTYFMQLSTNNEKRSRRITLVK